jgi:hypothetical protein
VKVLAQEKHVFAKARNTANPIFVKVIVTS